MDIRFKGERTYLHGTDICDVLLDRLIRPAGGTVTDMDLAFHRPARTALRLVRDGDPKAACSVLKHKQDGEPQVHTLEETGDPVSGRYPYDEAAIIRACTLDTRARTVEQDAAMDHSRIEIWVAMIKALHQKMFPDAPGQWMFGRLRLPDPSRIDGTGLCGAAFVAGMGGNKLTRNTISVGPDVVGEIFFILMEEN